MGSNGVFLSKLYYPFPPKQASKQTSKHPHSFSFWRQRMENIGDPARWPRMLLGMGFVECYPCCGWIKKSKERVGTDARVNKQYPTQSTCHQQSASQRLSSKSKPEQNHHMCSNLHTHGCLSHKPGVSNSRHAAYVRSRISMNGVHPAQN